MKNIILITNIPNPYRIPLFNKLNKYMNDNNMQLFVLFGAQKSTRRKFKIDMSEAEFFYRILPTIKIKFRDVEKTSYTYGNLYGTLKEIRPDAVIVNGFSIAAIKIWFHSLIFKTKYIIWSGAIMHNTVRITYMRNILRRLIVKRSAAYIAYGELAKKYLIFLGASSESVFIGINTVDVGYFIEKTKKYRNSKYYNEGNNNLLCVSYLTPRKNVDQVLRVVQLLSTYREDFILDIVGDGPEMNRLQDMTIEYGIEHLVRFNGFVQKTDLPEYYGKSICFLFPTSYDIWGLTLVEAMASGLICIASNNAGATHDLIQQGVTGYSVDYEEPEKICDLIRSILNQHDEARKIGENASEYIQNKVTLDKSAQGFYEAIASVVN